MEFKREMNLNELTSSGKVIIKFHAVWCTPCKIMSPILDKMEEEMDIKVISINAEEFPELSKQYEVSSVPSMFFYNDGEMIGSGKSVMTAQNILKYYE